MRTEVSFQDFNEKEKKKIFGSISPQKLLFQQVIATKSGSNTRLNILVVLASVKLLRKLPMGSKMKRGVYDVAFKKIRIVKT